MIGVERTRRIRYPIPTEKITLWRRNVAGRRYRRGIKGDEDWRRDGEAGDDEVVSESDEGEVDGEFEEGSSEGGGGGGSRGGGGGGGVV